MELALSLVPQHYMKHEIIANENTPTQGILFCYMGRIDLLLTSFSKGEYTLENIATEQFNFLLERLGPGSSICSLVHCRPPRYWKHNVKIVSRHATTIFLLPHKVLYKIRMRTPELD
jgi:hypothetical protein